jgi:hypothetical protein
MSKEKFTQGEWEAHLGIMEPTFVHIGKEDDYVDGETPVICELHHGIKKIHPDSVGFDFDHSEMRANANLIAAAPEMYAKLKEIQSLFYTFSFRLLRCNETKNAEQWMKKSMEIQKLLAEARGEK